MTAFTTLKLALYLINHAKIYVLKGFYKTEIAGNQRTNQKAYQDRDNKKIKKAIKLLTH